MTEQRWQDFTGAKNEAAWPGNSKPRTGGMPSLDEITEPPMDLRTHFLECSKTRVFCPRINLRVGNEI